MISRVTIFWLIALAGMVLMTVTVSLEVDRVNAQIDRIAERKAAARERIALLDASYQLLISPERLLRLADRHLDLEEVRGDQLVTLDRLPDRMPEHTPPPTADQRKPGSGPKPGPNQFGQRDSVPQPPATPLPVPGARPTPPWLEAQDRPALQPVNLILPQRSPQ